MGDSRDESFSFLGMYAVVPISTLEASWVMIMSFSFPFFFFHLFIGWSGGPGERCIVLSVDLQSTSCRRIRGKT